MNDPSVATDVARLQAIAKEQQAVSKQLAALYEEWETLAE